MGGSSSKRSFFWQKKKKSPVRRAWSQLKGALPSKRRRRRKSVFSLDRLNLDNLKKEKHSHKRLSLPTDKKEPISLKRFSVSNLRKESIQITKKERGGGGLGKIGEEMRRASHVKTGRPSLSESGGDKGRK